MVVCVFILLSLKLVEPIPPIYAYPSCPDTEYAKYYYYKITEKETRIRSEIK